MFFQEYSRKIEEIHSNLLRYIEAEDNMEENYQNLINLFQQYKYDNDVHELKIFLYSLTAIAKNHHRESNFFNKIKKVLQHLKNSIIQLFTNLEIFNIFKGSKLIILFLIQEKVIIIDNIIINVITKSGLLMSSYQYLIPEVEAFINEEEKKQNEISINEKIIHKKFNGLQKDFYDKREIGENDDYISEMIRKDLIEEFIIFVKKENYSLISTIKPSIYEANPLLIKKTPTLIEYAAFFGSVQIFKYLYLNEVELTPSLWIYGIHSDNPEIIHILEERKILPRDKTYEECIKEAIKCHHNDIANYIERDLLKKRNEDNFDKNILAYAFHFYNFTYFTSENYNHYIFNYACKYDYYKVAEYFLKTRKMYVKETI